MGVMGKGLWLRFLFGIFVLDGGCPCWVRFAGGAEKRERARERERARAKESERERERERKRESKRERNTLSISGWWRWRRWFVWLVKVASIRVCTDRVCVCA